jgi:phosphate starvation-inducible membrane PsiE
LVDAFHLLALSSLGDILLLFIYLGFGAMVGIYFKTTRLLVRYLIYIAMAALGRVLLSFAIPVLRFGESD